MADDLKTSFFDFLKERTSTPLALNIIVAFAFFNWHVIIWLFYSNESSAELLIQQISGHNTQYIKPVIWGVGITLFYPLVNILIFNFIERVEITKNKIRAKLSKEKWHPDSFVQELTKKNNDLLNSLSNYRERENDIIESENEIKRQKEILNSDKEKLIKYDQTLKNYESLEKKLTEFTIPEFLLDTKIYYFEPTDPIINEILENPTILRNNTDFQNIKISNDLIEENGHQQWTIEAYRVKGESLIISGRHRQDYRFYQISWDISKVAKFNKVISNSVGHLESAKIYHAVLQKK